MRSHKTYPLIADVEAQTGKRLLIRFRNGVTKLYDCKKILALPAFEALRSDEALFRRVHTDKHGYGVIWNDELDLAESEVWIGGHVVREKPEAYGNRVGSKATKKVVATKRNRPSRTPSDRRTP